MSVSIHVSSKNLNAQHNNERAKKLLFNVKFNAINILLPSQGYLVDVERAI